MIKINVAEIKKKLVGSESFQYTLTGKELNILPEDAELQGPITIEGTLANGGDVFRWQPRRTSRCGNLCRA